LHEYIENTRERAYILVLAVDEIERAHIAGRVAVEADLLFALLDLAAKPPVLQPSEGGRACQLACGAEERKIQEVDVRHRRKHGPRRDCHRIRLTSAPRRPAEHKVLLRRLHGVLLEVQGELMRRRVSENQGGEALEHLLAELPLKVAHAVTGDVIRQLDDILHALIPRPRRRLVHVPLVELRGGRLDAVIVLRLLVAPRNRLAYLLHHIVVVAERLCHHCPLVPSFLSGARMQLL
jgi:hypothetical protein